MDSFNIYVSGVGGQGIGLLTEVMLRAADHSGLPVKGVDTHGLAQRGGMVVSHLRFGENVFTPLIPEKEADMVVSLELHEALRATNALLKDGGVLAYYHTIWQPLDVRLGQAEAITEEKLNDQCRLRDIRTFRAYNPDLRDSRMQNVVLLALLARNSLIPGLSVDNYKAAMEDLMEGNMLEKNVSLFETELTRE